MTAVMSTNCKRALFLDRDGVFNINHGYHHSKGDFDSIDVLFELVRAVCSLGYPVAIVTNQTGIGRAHYLDSQFHDFTALMRERLEHHDASFGRGVLLAVLPKAGVCEYRRQEGTCKPGTGMILFSLGTQPATFWPGSRPGGASYCRPVLPRRQQGFARCRCDLL
jgi:D-glycero-D-manno-heptose 1,7-bisphosphate phosphatase